MVDDIVDFVRGRLGCQCPPEVFQSIAVGRDPDFDVLAPGSRLIRIGGRLLVLVVSGPNIQALPAMLSELVDTHPGATVHNSSGGRPARSSACHRTDRAA
jgi:hypothetical protein